MLEILKVPAIWALLIGASLFGILMALFITFCVFQVLMYLKRIPADAESAPRLPKYLDFDRIGRPIFVIGASLFLFGFWVLYNIHA